MKEIDISKAIKWVLGVMDGNGEEPTKNKKEVIECLQQAKAYKAIVEEIEDIYCGEAGNILIEYTFYKIKHKHLPKSIELSQAIDEFSKELCKVALTCEEIARRLTLKK